MYQPACVTGSAPLRIDLVEKWSLVVGIRFFSAPKKKLSFDKLTISDLRNVASFLQCNSSFVAAAACSLYVSCTHCSNQATAASFPLA